MVDSQAVVFTEKFSTKMFQLLTAPQKNCMFFRIHTGGNKLDSYCECSKDTSILTLSGLTLKLLCLTLLKDGLPHPESSETETEKIQLPLEFLTCALICWPTFCIGKPFP